MRSTSLATPWLAGCLVLLAGCGSDASDSTDQPADSVPITARAIAAVALEHLPTDTVERRATDIDRHDPKGSVGADLTYSFDGELYDDLVQVIISPSGFTCSEVEGNNGCEEREVEGGSLFLVWREGDAEDSAGVISSVMVRDGERVEVRWYLNADYLDGDPREQDLSLSLVDMEATAQDPRLGLMTTQDTVDAGSELEWP
jgi:hypothetical protein